MKSFASLILAVFNSISAFVVEKVLSKLPDASKHVPKTKPLLLLPVMGLVKLFTAASLYTGYEFVTRADNLSTLLFQTSVCALIGCLWLAGYAQQLSLRMVYDAKNAPKRRKSR